MSDSGQDENGRSWWEKPDAEATSPTPHGSEQGEQPAADVHDPYRGGSDQPAGSGAADQQPTQGLPQYDRQPGQSYEQQYGQQQGQPGSGRPQYGPPPGYGQPSNAQWPNQQYPNEQYAGQGYGRPYPGYGSEQQPPVAGMAHAVLWTAVGGLVLFFTGVGWIASIVALALVPGARREIMESHGAKRGLGFLLAGKVCAWVNIGFTVLFVLGLVVLFAVLGAGRSFDGGDSFNSVSYFAR